MNIEILGKSDNNLLAESKKVTKSTYLRACQRRLDVSMSCTKPLTLRWAMPGMGMARIYHMMRICVYLYMYLHIYIYTCIHTYKYKYIYIYTKHHNGNIYLYNIVGYRMGFIKQIKGLHNSKAIQEYDLGYHNLKINWRGRQGLPWIKEQ